MQINLLKNGASPRLARVVETLMEAPAGKGFTTSNLMKVLNVSLRTLTRVKEEGVKLGWLVTGGSDGPRSEHVWALTEQFRATVTLDDENATADLKDLATAADGIEQRRELALTFQKRKFRSMPERDVAVILHSTGTTWRAEFPYKTLMPNASIPDWVADFVVKEGSGDAVAIGVIEVAGVKGLPEYLATLQRKGAALEGRYAYLEILSEADYRKIGPWVVALRAQAEERQRRRGWVDMEPGVPDAERKHAYENANGVYIDPRGIKKRRPEGVDPAPHWPAYGHPAPLPRIDPDPEDARLRRAREAVEDRRDQEQQAAIREACKRIREEFQAKWDAEDAVTDKEEVARRLSDALEWDQAQYRARRVKKLAEEAKKVADEDAKYRPEEWEVTEREDDSGYDPNDDRESEIG